VGPFGQPGADGAVDREHRAGGLSGLERNGVDQVWEEPADLGIFNTVWTSIFEPLPTSLFL
jgi:hypothetical protein